MSKHYPKIWFLRHGQTEWNKAYRLQGQLDSPLTPQGIAEAERQAVLIAPVLAQNPPIITSPLGRVRQTADIALNGHAYRTDDRLKEIHAGQWQGRTRAEIFAEHPKLGLNGLTALDIYAAATGGEGRAALDARISSFLVELTRPTVVVAHGLLGQVLRAHVCGLPADEAGQLSNHQGCVYVLEHGQETVWGVDH